MSFSDADILDRLYAASFDPEALTDALRMIGDRLGSPSLNMRVLNTQTFTPIVHAADGPMHTDPAIMQDYFSHWVQHDTHMHAAARPGFDGRILTDVDLIDEETARRDAYLNEFYYKIGCGPMIGWVTTAGDEATIFGASRAADQDAYDDDAVRRLAVLRTHIDRALRLAAGAATGRLSSDEVAQAQLREQTVLLRCAGDGRVVIASPGSAEVIGAGGAARLSRDRVIWRDPGFEALFARICRAAADRDVRGLMQFVVREADGAVLRVAAAPGPEASTALVIIRRIRRPGAIEPAVLQASFGLSHAEARVAIAVAEGRSLPEIAATHGVKHATVRTQLRSAFEKLGVNRQSELAGLLARLT